MVATTPELRIHPRVAINKKVLKLLIIDSPVCSSPGRYGISNVNVIRQEDLIKSVAHGAEELYDKEFFYTYCSSTTGGNSYFSHQWSSKKIFSRICSHQNPFQNHYALLSQWNRAWSASSLCSVNSISSQVIWLYVVLGRRGKEIKSSSQFRQPVDSVVNRGSVNRYQVANTLKRILCRLVNKAFM